MMNGSDLLAWPKIIQGGMGIGVSNYRLARAVSMRGALGVVSGTALDTVFVRRLQLGDPSGSLRRAVASFPCPEMAERVLQKYFIPGGKARSEPFRLLSLPNATLSRSRMEVLVVANFVEVFLAKEGHAGLVGINLLEKIQIPTLPSLFGAMLAGVDAVLMGAGIPLSIPGVLERLSRWEAVELRLHVESKAAHEPVLLRFDPTSLLKDRLPLERPKFLAIVSSHVIAKTLLRKASGPVDGFIVEDHSAGGHNAPPRRQGRQPGEEVGFGPLDAPDSGAFCALGKPFWLAGSSASREKLTEALALGAHGVQLGTAFAFTEEAAIAEEIKRDVVKRAKGRSLRVITDFEASPTGYPFKIVVREEGELANLRARTRVCDLGYLRQAYLESDGTVGYRCPGEPIPTYVKKGGKEEDTTNKLCLCNQLLATVELGQERPTGSELPLLTSGMELAEIARFVRKGADSYTVADVLSVMNGESASLPSCPPLREVPAEGLPIRA